MAISTDATYTRREPPLERTTRGVTWLLIAVACGISTARILNCQSPDPKRPVPFMSANDRSRWCTVRALVDHQTYAIDPVIDGENGAWWDTIDKVRHAGPDGQMHFYSSKPPLWPTMLAAQYWLIKQATGWTMEDDLFSVVRLMLLLNNVTALALLIWFLGRIAERLSPDVWARVFVVTAGASGTFLTTFSVTLNNHLPAAAMAAMALLLAVNMMRSHPSWWQFFLLGLFAGSAAALELPAAGWLAICSVIAFGRSFGKALLGFVPAVAIVAAAFFGTNFLAHGQWRIAYDYRGDGPNIANLSGDFATELDSGVLPKSLLDIALQAREKLGFEVNAAAPVEPRTGGVVQVDRRQWVVNSDRPDQFLIEEVAPKHFSIRSWRNWYDFPGSYWRYDNQRKSPIDRGEPDQVKYLLHMVVGHHGVLSLTPIFVLSVLGVIPICFNGRYRFRFIGLMTLALTVVVFAFYVRLDGADRNYGGMTSGLRWMFWLYPFWLVWMVPVLEWSSRRTILLLVCVLLLAASVASAAYSFENPWVHPWLYEVLKNRGIPV